MKPGHTTADGKARECYQNGWTQIRLQ